MSYLVLARKYRPQTFAEVVRQEHVTRTLQNAISANRVAHAILFSGPRGTGKTTIARILAKAMNCENGPAPVPCNQCRSCREITNSSAVDVFEIDGASNNGVDQIRDLRENIKYMPAHSRYKIYIIDEVHMLSTAAFNALLKTLEEPPAHVIFLFATTEPHKIPITILSRCQRHDLRRVALADVVAHMESLCQKEGARMDPESLELIARESGGSIRDGLSLLDHVMSCAQNGAISHPQVLEILGVVDRKVIFALSRAAFARDIPAALEILDALYDHGHNIKELHTALIEHFRNLLLVKMGGQKLVDLPEHEISAMAEQVRDIPDSFISQILDRFFKEETTVKYSAQPKLALELIFIRLAQTGPVLAIDTLIDKIDALTQGIDDGSVPLPPPPQPRASAGAVPPPPDRESGGQAPGAGKSRSGTASAPQPAPAPGPSRPAPASQPSAEACYDAALDPETNWQRLLTELGEKSPALCACLKKCDPETFCREKVELTVSGNGFNLNRVQKKENQIRECCAAFFGGEPELVIRAGEKQSFSQNQQKNKKDELRQEALNHPLVDQTMEIFGGRVVEVKILKEVSRG